MVTKESKISDIIRENPERVLTLDKYGVKFYQNPGITLMEACTGKKIDLNHLINDLERLEKGASILINWENWSLDFMITYLENNHHANIRSLLGKDYVIFFIKYLQGKENENKEIDELFSSINAHLKKEERMLFPYIKQIEIVYANGLEFEYANFGTLPNVLRVINKEHSQICAYIDNVTTGIDRILDKASLEVKKSILKILEGIKKDFHLHVYLEENVIFPKALTLEEELINNFNISKN